MGRRKRELGTSESSNLLSIVSRMRKIENLRRHDFFLQSKQLHSSLTDFWELMKQKREVREGSFRALLSTRITLSGGFFFFFFVFFLGNNSIG